MRRGERGVEDPLSPFSLPPSTTGAHHPRHHGKLSVPQAIRHRGCCCAPHRPRWRWGDTVRPYARPWNVTASTQGGQSTEPHLPPPSPTTVWDGGGEGVSKTVCAGLGAPSSERTRRPRPPSPFSAPVDVPPSPPPSCSSPQQQHQQPPSSRFPRERDRGLWVCCGVRRGRGWGVSDGAGLGPVEGGPAPPIASEGTARGARYGDARGEILRPPPDPRRRRRSASACSSIKNESVGSEDDQTPS